MISCSSREREVEEGEEETKADMTGREERGGTEKKRRPRRRNGGCRKSGWLNDVDDRGMKDGRRNWRE